MRDTIIRLDVIDELVLEFGKDAAGIGVLVRRGIVTLAGRVAAPAVRSAAVAAALRVRGARDVVDALSVGAAGMPRDDDLARRAAAMLETAIEPTEELEIKVQEGWILLTGRVLSQSSKVRAQSVLGWLAGVEGIVNLVEVAPPMQLVEGAIEP